MLGRILGFGVCRLTEPARSSHSTFSESALDGVNPHFGSMVSTSGNRHKKKGEAFPAIAHLTRAKARW